MTRNVPICLGMASGHCRDGHTAKLRVQPKGVIHDHICNRFGVIGEGYIRGVIHKVVQDCKVWCTVTPTGVGLYTRRVHPLGNWVMRGFFEPMNPRNQLQRNIDND